MPLVVLRLGQLFWAGLVFIGADVVDQVHEGIERIVAQVEEAVLGVFCPLLEFFLREMMATLARAVHFQQRAVHVVVADLQATPERACTPKLQSSNSGWRGLMSGAPLCGCCHSVTLSSSSAAMMSSTRRPFVQGKVSVFSAPRK